MPLSRIAMALAVFSMIGCATTQQPAAKHGSPDAKLHAEIAAADTALFERFNAHDTDGLMQFFSDDLEFYHDSGGLVRRAEVDGGFRKMFEQNNGIRRDLVPGTLRVYPIPNYGAMELGSHRFCHVENGKNDCGVFEFAQVWKRTGNGWIITRVLSYGH
ncbi:MAG TPA: nuclear transport factor 2 family protein [Thermoanaerobaculia bacterium]|nr:nuclear transport factor 2 family protein [Thermoanaerobaculia bacterium]